MSDNSSPRRPKRPLHAYQHFFREEVKKLSGACEFNAGGSSETGAVETVETISSVGALRSRRSSGECPPASKRRRSDALSDESDSEDDCNGTRVTSLNNARAAISSKSTALEEVGKRIGERWRELTDEERARYEELASEDSDRYEREIEKYYKKMAEQSRDCHGLALLSSHSSSPDLLDNGGATGGSTGHTRRLLGASKANRRSSASDAIVKASDASKAYVGGSGVAGLAAMSGLIGGNLAKFGGKNDQQASLKALLTERRNELLSDVSTLHGIAASRKGKQGGRTSGGGGGGAGGSLYRNDATTMQRMYNLGVGPKSSHSFSSNATTTTLATSRLSTSSALSSVFGVSSSSLMSVNHDRPSISEPKTASSTGWSEAGIGNRTGTGNRQSFTFGSERLENTTISFSSSASEKTASPRLKPTPPTSKSSGGASLKNTKFNFSSMASRKTAALGLKPTAPTVTSGGGINRLKNTTFSFASGASKKTAATALKPTPPAVISSGGKGGVDRLKTTTFNFSSGTSTKTATLGLKPAAPTWASGGGGGGLDRLKNTTFSFASGASKNTATSGLKPAASPVTGSEGSGGFDRLKGTTLNLSSNSSATSVSMGSGKLGGKASNAPLSCSGSSSSGKESS